MVAIDFIVPIRGSSVEEDTRFSHFPPPFFCEDEDHR
jgi:hypothetical protein